MSWDSEQMVFGEAGESWDYEDDSLDGAVSSAAAVAAASEPDLWFAEKHIRQVRRLRSDCEMTARAFRDEIERLTDLLIEIESKADSKIGWHQRQVEGFHRALESEGRIGRKLQVPSGVSTLRKSQPEITFEDETAFLEYVTSENAEADLLTAPRPGIPSKSGVKRKLRLVESDGEPGTRSLFVDAEGVVVPGVVARFRHDAHGLKVEGS